VSQQVRSHISKQIRAEMTRQGVALPELESLSRVQEGIISEYLAGTRGISQPQPVTLSSCPPPRELTEKGLHNPCEGLNLQTLGTLINVDLPWNPTRLEQHIGRIKRFGQRRETVDMLNLVFEQTVDEKIYERLSERMRNRYDLFGSLPDTIKDEWIEDIESLGEKLDEYINARLTATGFDLRYIGTMAPPEKDWRDCSEVLARRDFISLMSAAWG